MSLNPYAPPTAVVADLACPDDVRPQPPFFAVSATKLVIMSVCTFNVYEFYWFYRQWKHIAGRSGEGISPLARAIFTIFYCQKCFASINEYDAERTGSPLATWPLAVGWIGTTLVSWRLPDTYSWISMLAVVFVVPVQMHVNRLNAASTPLHNRNTRFSAWNWLAVVVGGLFLLLAVVGTFLPDVD